MDTQALQLHEKVQKLIEQYTKDKQKMAEIEAALNEKTTDNESFLQQINQMQQEIQILTEQNTELIQENNTMEAKKKELESMLSTFEVFANDLNSRIDNLIPQIENL